MAVNYKTPGVYVEEIPKFPPSVAPVETAIPAFIGYTQMASDKPSDVKPTDDPNTLPHDSNPKPRRITSMVDYEKHFGWPQPEDAITVDATVTTDNGVKTPHTAVASFKDQTKRSKHIMYYALQMFFANGGGPCYVVSVGSYKTPVGTAPDKGDLLKGLDAVKKEEEPTLIVFPEAQGLSIADFKDLHTAALDQCFELMDRFVIMDVHGDTESMSDPDADLLMGIRRFRGEDAGKPAAIGISGDKDHLKYGAAYAPNIETTIDFAFDETKTKMSITTDGAAPTTPFLNSLEASDNALYAMAKAAIAELPCTLPPSAAVAGIYAAVDNSRGVWKAPANVSVAAVIAPTIQFTNKDQDEMNVDTIAGKSVNAIRPFIGQGSLVWGARTLAGNDNEWRYVSVRRFFIFVEKSVKNATMQFVFEPNDANTWVKVQGMIENFLTTLWRQGAMQGVKPEDAFYVAVGLGKTMTALDILEGRMIVEIGMAAVRPAEFIILRFSHKMAVS